MDKIDHAILGLLARDGRLSFRELGEAVHLSANAVADRYRRLRSAGVIRAIRAEIEPAALGRTLEAQIDVKLAAETAALAFEAHAFTDQGRLDWCSWVVARDGAVVRQVAAETLGVPLADVYVDTADSDTGPPDQPMRAPASSRKPSSMQLRTEGKTGSAAPLASAVSSDPVTTSTPSDASPRRIARSRFTSTPRCAAASSPSSVS